MKKSFLILAMFSLMMVLTSFTTPIGGKGTDSPVGQLNIGGKGTDSPVGQFEKSLSIGGKGTDSPVGQLNIGGKGTDSPVGQ